MRRINQRLPFLRNERGVALPLALMAFVVLGAFSAALLAVGSSEVQIASNHLGATQANFLAEAGLEDAFNTLRTNQRYTTNASATPTYIAYNSQFGGVDNAIGNYMVTYQTAGTYTFRVVSTGTSFIGGIGGLGGDQRATAQKILRAVMSTSFSSNDAIRTNGPLTISGNPTVTDPVRVAGQCGNVHTNDDILVSGSPSISGAATASGGPDGQNDYTITGNPTVGPGSGGDQSAKPIPVIDPTNFLNTAKATLPATQVFQMMANGQVLDGDNNLITTLVSGDDYHEWRYTAGSPAQWQLSGNTGINGIYYFEGNVSVSGNPGTSSTPWVTTLIATGDITVSGNPEIQTSLTDTLFIAGLDVSISGNPHNGFNGLIAAHEQFSLSGNPTINGFIIAEDASHTSNTVTSNTVNGNPTINYDCGLNPPLQGPLQVISWGL